MAETSSKQLATNSETAALLRRFVHRVQLEKGGIQVTVNLRASLGDQTNIEDAAELIWRGSYRCR